MNLVYEFLTKEINLQRNDKVVVGVSAGPDSMFLLYILMELRKKIGFTIIVSHINHKVRIESDEEEKFLKKYCLDNNIEICCMEINEYNKENFHAYARNIRYNFYKEIVSKYNASYLMTAHHGDDLMETILMRLTRGSTLSGYHGISLVTDMTEYKIVRPLLFMTKDAIKEFNDLNNIPYRIDKSNLSLKYTRNRYRKNILPFLKEEEKNVHLKFLKFSRILEESNNYIDKIVNNVYKKVYNDRKINILLFREEDLFVQKLVIEKVIKSIYDNLSKIENKHINLIINLVKKNKTGISINLPNNIIVRIDYDNIVFLEKKDNTNYRYELIDGLTLENGMKFKTIKSKENGNDTLHLDSSMVKLPLYVRNKHEGDYIELKGTNGVRRVSDIFIDNKITRGDRNNYPVVVDSLDRVIWIPKLKKSKYDSQNHEKCDIIIKCL